MRKFSIAAAAFALFLAPAIAQHAADAEGRNVIRDPVPSLGGADLAPSIEEGVRDVEVEAPDLETIVGELFVGSWRSRFEGKKVGKFAVLFATPNQFFGVANGEAAGCGKATFAGTYTYEAGRLTILSTDIPLDGPNTVSLAPYSHDFQFDATLLRGNCRGEGITVSLRHMPLDG